MATNCSSAVQSRLNAARDLYILLLMQVTLKKKRYWNFLPEIRRMFASIFFSLKFFVRLGMQLYLCFKDYLLS